MLTKTQIVKAASLICTLQQCVHYWNNDCKVASEALWIQVNLQKISQCS